MRKQRLAEAVCLGIRHVQTGEAQFTKTTRLLFSVGAPT